MADFVGRQAEMEALGGAAAWLLARSTGVRAVAVTGEPGIGKSRLLREAVANVSGPVRTIGLTGFEPERQVPLAAAQPLIREVLPSGTKVPTEQVALFEAIHAVLAAQRVPTLIVLDDLQWVDEASLALFHYVVRGAEADTGIRLALILAGRPEPVAATFLDALRRLLDDRLTRLILEPLGPAAARRLARQLSPTSDPAHIADRAAGSPFWIEVLAASGGDVEASELVNERLQRMDGDEAELLTLLAVAGHPLSAADQTALLGWAGERCHRAVRRLVTAGLARVIGDSAGMNHDLIREAVTRGAETATVTRLHRHLADHLEGSAGDDIGLLKEALDHRTAAGDVDLGLALRIASAPNRRLLGAHGLAHLIGLTSPAEADDASMTHLHRALGHLADEMGASSAAHEQWSAVIDSEPAPARRAEAALAAARAAFELGDAARARALLVTAREAASRAPAAWISVTADALESSIARWLDGSPPEARKHAERALAAARALWPEGVAGGLSQQERDAYLAALQASHDAAMQAIERGQMLTLSAEMVTVAVGSAAPDRLHAAIQAGVAHNMSGQLSAAETSLRRAWDESQRFALPQHRAEAGYFLALTLIDAGPLAEAALVARETAALLARTEGHLSFGNRIATPLALIDILGGDWRAGLRRLEDDISANQDPHSRLRSETNLASCLAHLRGAAAGAEVRQAAEAALRDAAASGCRRCTQEAQVICAEALASSGHAEAAATLLADWQRARPAEANLTERIHAERTAARLNPTRRALTGLLQSATEAVEARHVVEAALTMITIGDLTASGDRLHAIEVLREAIRITGETGMTNLEGLARQRVRALGARAWRRAAAPATAAAPHLTAREREVAQRIESGETNAQIALALFLSPRTVDRHVQNILRKVGVRSRAAIASAIRAQEMGTSADDRSGPRS